MEEKSEESPNVSAKKQSILCEECKKNPSKYKCPGCSFHSCSLPCVNSHKQRTACTGKRRLSDVIPISQFDDNLLLSDYNMLEEVKRMAESAKRMRFTLCGYSNFRLPSPLKSLQSAAASRKIKLLFLSSGMSRREKNKTYYNNRKKIISWTIEWRFHSTDVVLVDHGVNESTTISSVIENHLKPGPWNHTLKQFCDEALESLKFFIRKYPKGQKSPFRHININEPIREQLRDIVILEYPVIHVLLPSHNYDFEVIKGEVPSKVDLKEPARHDDPDPKSVTFREEEIKDEKSSDPLISDLMNHTYPSIQTEEEANESLQSLSAILGTEDINTGSKPCIEQLTDIADVDFDFDPGLMDIYSDIIAEGNTDDFLNFDGVLADGGGFLLDEELEEGEIA